MSFAAPLHLDFDCLVTPVTEVGKNLVARVQRAYSLVTICIRFQSRFKNRRITGATTKVPSQAAPQLLLVEGRVFLQQPRHRDYESRRAEAALRAVAIDHRPLDSARSGFAPQAFDRDDVRRFQLKHE